MTMEQLIRNRAPNKEGIPFYIAITVTSNGHKSTDTYIAKVIKNKVFLAEVKETAMYTSFRRLFGNSFFKSGSNKTEIHDKVYVWAMNGQAVIGEFGTEVIDFIVQPQRVLRFSMNVCVRIRVLYVPMKNKIG